MAQTRLTEFLQPRGLWTPFPTRGTGSLLDRCLWVYVLGYPFDASPGRDSRLEMHILDIFEGSFMVTSIFSFAVSSTAGGSLDRSSQISGWLIFN